MVDIENFKVRLVIFYTDLGSVPILENVADFVDKYGRSVSF